MASDTLMMQGDGKTGFVKKIARNDVGDLAGAAGDACYNHQFIRWFLDGEQGDPPQARHEPNASFDRGLIVRAGSRKIEVFESRGRFDCEAPYYAMGSGGPEARGAMHAGADAQAAVRAAIAHDAGCGGVITVLSHTA